MAPPRVLLGLVAVLAAVALAPARSAAGAAEAVYGANAAPAEPQATLAPGRLRTELAAEQLAAPVRRLRLTWEPRAPSSARSLQQTGYEVNVTRTADRAVVWASGRVRSAESLAIVGAELEPDTAYSWSVRVWINDQVSPWTPRVHFWTAPSADSWAASGARPIGGFNQLRCDYTVVPPFRSRIVRAAAHVTGLGAFYFYANGHRIEDHIMDPGQTVYTQRLLFVTFNITRAIVPGPNIFAVELGNYKWGYLDVWCNMTAAGGPDGCRMWLMQVVVEFSDGQRASYVTDPRRCFGRHGPIVYDHLYHGEVYDARAELDGWNSRPLSTWPEGVWSPVLPMQPAIGELSPQLIPPVRITESFAPISITRRDISECPTPYLGGLVQENDVLDLVCVPGTGVITSIDFAAYGVVSGDCAGGFVRNPSCDAPFALRVVAAACLNKESCSIRAVNDVFGGDPCYGTPKVLAVRATGCVGKPSGRRRTSWLFDFGQNMAGFTSILLPPALTSVDGLRIVLQHAEITNLQGDAWNVYGGRCEPDGGNCANQTDTYITRVSGVETMWMPKFTYHGFRFVQVYGLPDGFTPSATFLWAHFVHTDVERVGAVHLPMLVGRSRMTPNILNRIQNATVAAQRSQLWSIPTDCPQREKRGWMGDAFLSSNEAMFNFDMQAFYESWLRSIRDDQRRGCASRIPTPCPDPAAEAGSVGDVSPFERTPYGLFPGSPAWQAAYTVISRNMYRNYGNLEVIETLYDGLVEHMAYYDRHRDRATGLVLFGGLGDWVPPGGNDHQKTPTPAVSAYTWLMELADMAVLAQALGRTADAAAFAQNFTIAAEKYTTVFYNHSAGGYSGNSQTSNLMPLSLGIVPDAYIEEVKASLLADIEQRHVHLDTGIIGVALIFDVLTRVLERDDLAIEMLLDDSHPSFGYMISEQATTLWESWEGTEHEQVGSRNHIMYGGNVGIYPYTALAGIDTVSSAASTAWHHLLMGPTPSAATLLGSASASVLTPRGLASVSWSWHSPRFSINVTVPIGSTAEVSIPDLHSDIAVYESGTIVWRYDTFLPGAPGVIDGRVRWYADTPVLVLRVMSGSYVFWYP